MGGATLQDLQSWDKQGRKQGLGEIITNLLKDINAGKKAAKTSQQEDIKLEADMRGAGFEPKQGAGMGSAIAKALGMPGQYEYNKEADYKRNYYESGVAGRGVQRLTDPATGEVYLAKLNPVTGQWERVDVAGAGTGADPFDKYF